MKPREARNTVLLLAGYGFYAAWDARFLALLVLSTLVDLLTDSKIEFDTRVDLMSSLLNERHLFFLMSSIICSTITSRCGKSVNCAIVEVQLK